MSIGKLAEVTNTPIDSDTANQILVEMMNNGELKTKYKDFEIHASSNDVFYWEGMVKTGHFHDDMIENITIAATPFWDGVKYTPVEIEWFTLFNYYGMTVYETSGEGSFYKELKHQTNFESVDELLNWYEVDERVVLDSNLPYPRKNQKKKLLSTYKTLVQAKNNV